LDRPRGTLSSECGALFLSLGASDVRIMPVSEENERIEFVDGETLDYSKKGE
jgi:predicted Ser/Thr protein kinase